MELTLWSRYNPVLIVATFRNENYMRPTNRIAVLVVGLLSLSNIVAGRAAAHDSYSPKVGEAHPNFVLPNIEDGSAVELSHFRGKKVLLIHFASW